jgi:peptidoglycan endopeptidase LytE
MGKPPVKKRRYFMMKRRIFLWMGLIVLFFSFGIYQDIQAKERYKIKRGDTLAGIAKKTGVSIEELKKANKLQSTNLKPGKSLQIPQQSKKNIAKSIKSPSSSMSHYTVKKGDSLYTVAKKTGLKVHDICRWNHVQARSLRIGQRLVLSKPWVVIQAARVVADAEEDTDVSNKQDEEGDDLDSFDEDDADWTQFELDNQEKAALLGKWNSPDERRLFVRVVMGFLGAPYRFGGSSVQGLDCSAFVKKIYQFFDVDLPRTAFEQARVGQKVDRESLEEGDLVFFNTWRTYGHVGIYIGNNEFIHASSRDRHVKVESLNSPYYDKRFIKAVRLKGLDTGA